MNAVGELRQRMIAAGQPLAHKLSNRVYDRQAPQGAKYPYAVLRQVGQPDDEHTFVGPADLGNPSIQVSFWAVDPADLDLIGPAFRRFLNGYADDQFVLFVENETHDLEELDSRRIAYAIHFDCEIWRQQED